MRDGIQRGRVAFGGLLLASLGAPVFAQDAAPILRVAVTRHVWHGEGGKTLPYTATVEDHLVLGSDGKPGSRVVTIAYTAEGKDPARRPVVFAFNGGPGASSSPLHMSALGPARRADDSDRASATVVDNPTSPIAAADLVFIDPVSTGFSRALPGVDPKQWYNSEGDAREVAFVIEDWLKTHHRERSPRFLCGESYGTQRAGYILKYVPGLHFQGVILVSAGGGGPIGPDTAAINRVGAMAAAAWHHQKADRRGLTVQAFYAEAMHFARGDYASALAQGADLSPERKAEIARRLSAYIGLPPELIEAKNLKVDENTFMFTLLKDKGLRTGRLDTRVTSELLPNASGGIDDPSLGVIKPRAGGAAPTPEQVGAVPSPGVGRYIAETLKFPSADPYFGVNFQANSQWRKTDFDGKHEEPTGVLAARAMQADPKLRLLVVAGIFDLGAADGEGFLKGGADHARFTMDLFPGPHEVYSGADNRKRFDRDITTFILGANKPS